MASNLEAGMKLHALYTDGEYYPAEVLQVSTAKNRSKAPVKVSYKGFEGSDTWLSLDKLKSKAAGLPPKGGKKEPAGKKGKAEPKAAGKKGAKAKEPAKEYDYSGMEKGMKCQADGGDGKYYSAEVVAVSKKKGGAVKVHFVGYEKSADEWVTGERLKSKAMKVITPKPAKGEKGKKGEEKKKAATPKDLKIAKYFTASFAPNPMIVDIFAREKGIDLSTVEEQVDILTGKNREEENTKKNPSGQLPYFELTGGKPGKDGAEGTPGKVIAETIAMCEYLEEQQPAPALIGATAAERANTRMWQRRMEEHYCLPSFNAFRSWTASADCDGAFKDFFKGKVTPENGGVLLPSVYKDIQSQCLGRLKWVEAQKKEKDTPYICGQKVTMVDIQVFCCLDFFADKSQPFLADNKESMPWWNAWYERMNNRRAVKSCKSHIEWLGMTPEEREAKKEAKKKEREEKAEERKKEREEKKAAKAAEKEAKKAEAEAAKA